MNQIITVRDLAMVTSDIQYAQKQGARQLASNLIEIGRLLTEAKAMVEPKNWEKYIWDNFGYSTSSADNWMKLYREYGNNQESLFDSFRDSQTFGKLSYTQLLALTALPAEEREEFAQKNDVENMSTRELQRAIKERDEARKAQEAAENGITEMKAALAKAQAEAEGAVSGARESAERLEKANALNKKAGKDLKDAKKQLADARAREEKLKEDLKKALENPDIPEAVMERMRKEAEAKAAEKETEAYRKKLEEAEKAKADAEANTRNAEAKLAEAQKQIQLANPDIAVFRTLFEQVQTDFNRMSGVLLKVRETDPASAEKLKAAVMALLDKLRGTVVGK